MIPQRNKQIVFQDKVSLSDGMGGITDTWGDSITHYAAIRPLTGKEVIESGKIQHELTHRFFMRYRDGITPDMRIRYHDYRAGSDRYFDIVSLLNKNEAYKELEILATEVKD